MDAFEQLTTQVIPALVNKIKEQKDSIIVLEARVAAAENRLHMSNLSDAYDIDKSLRDILGYARDLDRRLAILEAQPAPAPKKRAPRKKKEEVAAPVDDGTPGVVAADLTGDDILCANYALCATKGDIDEALPLIPDMTREAFAKVDAMPTKDIVATVAAKPVTLTNIDAKFASANWREIK